MIEWLVNKRVFRNANHAIWFLTSLGFLLVTLAWHFFPNQRLIFLIIPMVIHLPPLVTSIAMVLMKKKDDEIYSSDCIWFNAIMILAYIVLFLFL